MELETANKVLNDSIYINDVKRLADMERDRIFCRHDMEHFLSVARLTIIMCNERNISVDPDIVYTAALLHDIGRIEQYRSGIPHDTASAENAHSVLERVGCDELMKQNIISLILSHRNENLSKNSLENIFRKADKKSRMCFFCSAQKECFWENDKRNMKIEV